MRETNQIIMPLLWLASLALVRGQEYPPVISCSDLTAPKVEGAVLVNITAEETNSSGDKSDDVDVCNVNIYLTHGDAGDHVRIQTYLPLHGYTGRYQGLGGAGMVAGFFDDNLASSAGAGFVTGSTDAGRPGEEQVDDTWAGDDQLLVNFAYLSVHEMTVVGKALAKQFYGRPVEYSYWNGCSNGGRQGYVSAQRYPTDYDGIMANAPAINWDRFLVSDLFPYLVQVSEKEFPPPCIWEIITAAAVSTCDSLDDGIDNVVNLPFECVFDATTTVGWEVCNTTINEAHARMWNDITRGPLDDQGSNIWAGLLPGTNFSILTGAGVGPFPISRAWVAAFVESDRNFSIDSIPRDWLYKEMAKSERMYRPIIGGDDPDLGAFRDAGGKLLTFHGLVDQTIQPYGTIDYRLRVEELLGGNEAVNEFYRLFLVPGIDHCYYGGRGAQPSDPFGLLMDWVEKGIAPDVMPAAGEAGDRNLCPFPKKLLYVGEGDLKQASSWTCL